MCRDDELSSVDFSMILPMSRGRPINQTLVNDLAAGGFIAQQRNVILTGGTGKTHLAITIVRRCIRSGGLVAENVAAFHTGHRDQQAALIGVALVPHGEGSSRGS